MARLSTIAVATLFLSLSNPVEATSEYAKTLNNTYEYIIVGGGVSGLVVANRLTQKSSTTVLVIEYGYIDNSTTTLWPYHATGFNTPDMFDIISAPQSNFDNQTFDAWVGKAVGGGSLVNGMGYDRGTQPDYDAWAELGNDGWDWDTFLEYFKKSSTFTPNTDLVNQEYNYTWDLSAFGDGPVQVSLPDFQYPEMETFWDAMDELNITRIQEGALGIPGAFWVPESKDPNTQYRSSARSAYYDPISSRDNLKLVTGSQVQSIIFSDYTAEGVTVIDRADGSTYTAHASKELILAAGALHTPQILQLSGVGPSNVLEAAGVDVRLDLPAVGANFQDHPTAYISFNLTTDTSFPTPDSLTNNATFNYTSYEEYVVNKTGPYTQAHGNGAAFLPLAKIAPESYGSIAGKLSAQNASDYLPSIYANHSGLLAGYEAQRQILVNQFTSNNASMYEYSFQGSGSAITALQKPTSRGTVYINPEDPYGEPIVDYHGLENPVDLDLLIASIRYTRRVFNTTALSSYTPVEIAPGAEYQTDDELAGVIKSSLVYPTFAHPAGTCAMMPEDLGGCVSSELLVYGLEKLSIVDASVMPMIPGTHLQATVYAIAEKAAHIIKARHGE